MEEIAGVVGALRDVEMALFSCLGRIAPMLRSADEVVWSSAASLRAAWRSAQLEQLLPVSVGLAQPAGATTTTLGSATAAALGAFDALAQRAGEGVSQATEGADSAAEGVVVELVSGWYASLLEAYRWRLARLSTAADGPFQRVLERLVSDLVGEQAALQGPRQHPGRGA
jgi:hypothetical protein